MGIFVVLGKVRATLGAKPMFVCVRIDLTRDSALEHAAWLLPGFENYSLFYAVFWQEAMEESGSFFSMIFNALLHGWP